MMKLTWKQPFKPFAILQRFCKTLLPKLLAKEEWIWGLLRLYILMCQQLQWLLMPIVCNSCLQHAGSHTRYTTAMQSYAAQGKVWVYADI